MQIMKKLTVGGVNGVKGGFVGVTATFLAMRIMGIASEAKNKPGLYGDALSFHGEFRAIDQHGEEFAAPICYLPAPADGLLLGAINGAAGQPVNFAFDIFVVPVEKKVPTDRGYEFKIKPLLETKPSNPLGDLMATLPPPAVTPKVPALPAGEGQEKTGDEKAATGEEKSADKKPKKS